MGVPAIQPRRFPAQPIHPVLRLNSPATLPLALAGLVAVTAICYWLNSGFAIAAFLYFVIVVLSSLGGRFRASVGLSLAAGFALEFFFVDPVLSFRVARVHDVLALATFAGTAIVVSYLSAQVNGARLAANEHREQIEQLYRLAHLLLAEDPANLGRSRVFELILEIFPMKGICIADDAEWLEYPLSSVALAEAARESNRTRRDIDDSSNAIAVRYLQGGRGWSGAVGFQGLAHAELLASPLAALTTLMLERMLAQRSVKRAEAKAETEVLRTAILDALAHEFKTPLATILTALGGIQEAGELQPAQAELAQLIEAEVVRLGSLTGRLVKVSHLTEDKIHVRLAMMDLDELTRTLIRRYSKLWPNRRYSLATSGCLTRVTADAELIKLAISQLLDNASKYSDPNSGVEIEVEHRNGMVSFCVWNQGPPISADERARIFERFFRGGGASSDTSGSGLGLYVVRRIADSHGGSVQLLPGGAETRHGFRLAFPATESLTGRIG